MHSVCRQREKVRALSGRPIFRNPVFLALLLMAFVWPSCAQETLGALHKAFADPPNNCRIMMRWWWFGPCVSEAGDQRELEEMKAGGIGGVEIATVYPQALDDPATGFHNSPYLSDEHLERLRFAADQAARLGLRVDVTLGSGWPFGGPHIPVTRGGWRGCGWRPSGFRQGRIGGRAGIWRWRKAAARLSVSRSSRMRCGCRGAATSEMSRRARAGTSARTTDRTALFFIASRTGMHGEAPGGGRRGLCAGPLRQRGDREAFEGGGRSR